MLMMKKRRLAFLTVFSSSSRPLPPCQLANPQMTAVAVAVADADDVAVLRH